MADIESNSYEELRRQRVQENLKHLEELGISQISKGLLEVAQRESKISKSQPKSKKSFDESELRRSSRAKNPVVLYQDNIGDMELGFHRSLRRRSSKNNRGERSYTGRIGSYKQIVAAIKRAEKLQSELNSNHPSFVKQMVRSHVSSCFWLGLPSTFCKENLPLCEFKMTLEDENGNEYPAIYIGSRAGLSGGWRGFAMDHNLEDGDALIFELSEPARFKVYIVKAIPEVSNTADNGQDAVVETTESIAPHEEKKDQPNSRKSSSETGTATLRKASKRKQKEDQPVSPKAPPETESMKPAHRVSMRKQKEDQPVPPKSHPETESVKPAPRVSLRLRKQ